MKKIIIFALSILMLNACSKTNEVTPKPNVKKVYNKSNYKGSVFIDMVVPTTIKSITNISYKVIYKDISILNPNSKTNYIGKLRVDFDAVGSVVKLSISENLTKEPFNFSDDILENPNPIDEINSCGDLRSCVYNKCMAEANSHLGTWDYDSVLNARAGCLGNKVVATIYDGSFGWFYGCYYSKC